MSVRDCIVRLKSEGKIDDATAAKAIGLWERYQGRFSLDMPPARAEAAAALEAARVLSQTAQKKKLAVALQVRRQTEAEARQFAHPQGPAAGAMAVLTRDIYEKGGANVDTRSQTIREALYARFNAGIEAYKSKLLGLKQDIAGVENLVRELHGVDTGDAVAKIAADGWTKAVEFGTAYAERAGKIFEANEDWRLPQFWSAERVRRLGTQGFLADLREAVRGGGLQVFDKERFEIATDPARIEALLQKAARDVATEAGSAPVFSGELRTFRFVQGEKGAEAWLALQGRYGSGRDILATLQNHLGSMGREAALVDVLGPQHAATVAMLEKNARQAAALAKDGRSALQNAVAALKRPQGWLESPGIIRRTYDVLTGRANGVESAALAGAMGATRSAITAASLGSATIPAVVGDSVTMLLASQHLRMDPLRVLGRTIDLLVHENPQAKEDAARLLVTGHAMADHALGTVRYADNLVGPDLMKRVASTVIRASGLAAWTEGAKKAFTLEALGLVASQSRHGFDALEPAFRRFLDRNRIDAPAWERLRALPPQDIMGGKFFDSSLAATNRDAQALFEGILHERAFAVLEPDARIRALTTGGVASGTLVGEMARNVALFKSFSMTMIATHMMRLATQDASIGSRLLNAAWFFGLHIAAGAAVVQARQIITGKDPIDMHSPKFWYQSAVQGGGLGFYGDLIANVADGGDRSFASQLAGPVVGLGDDIARLARSTVSKEYAGQHGGTVGQAIDLLHRNAPGSNLWFSRLATDRLIWDNLHKAIDPNYAASFARVRDRQIKAYGQQYWFGPGDTVPQRPPRALAGFGN